jgi:Tol biopolymer transport system component
MELTLGISPELRIDDGIGALSPDATQLVFPAQDASGVPRLWVRLLRSANARSLPGTDGASYPFWSPDGKSIAFFSAHKLKRMSMPDGPIQVIADAPMGRGGDWGQDGTILFSPQTADVLFQVPETGGTAHPATQLNAARQETAHRWPFFLPGGKEFLYNARSGVQGESGFCFASLGSTAATRILAQDPMSNAVVAHVPGSDRAYLLYVRNGNLLAQRFDARAKRVSGNPSTIATGLPVPSAGSPFAVAGNVLVYTRARRSAPASLTWYSISGQPLGTASPIADFSAIDISPDGSLVAFERLEEQYGTFDIWTLDLGRGILNRITSDPANDLSPVWSPGSRALVYSTERTGTGKLARKDLSGGPAVENLVTTCCAQTPSDWTRWGILFADDHAKTHLDVALFDPARPGSGAVPIASGPANERNGRISPDGTLIAYESDRTGGTEIHVRPRDPAAGDAQDQQASSRGGIRPRWSPDGKRIYYLAGLQRIMAVDIERSGTRFTLGAPRELFRVPGGRITSYALHPDGRRFLICSPAGPPPPSQLTILLNWFSDLP